MTNVSQKLMQGTPLIRAGAGRRASRSRPEPAGGGRSRQPEPFRAGLRRGGRSDGMKILEFLPDRRFGPRAGGQTAGPNLRSSRPLGLRSPPRVVPGRGSRLGAAGSQPEPAGAGRSRPEPGSPGPGAAGSRSGATRAVPGRGSRPEPPETLRILLHRNFEQTCTAAGILGGRGGGEGAAIFKM